jgi:hypothetical protein
MLSALLAVLGPIFGTVAKNLFPDPADQLKREELQQKLQLAVLEQSAAIEKMAGDIVKTEAASSHWLAANWRPLTALVFVGLVVARWLGYTAPNMTEAEYLAVYDIIQIMIGGYVLSRGAEKIVPGIVTAMKGGAK